MIKQIPFLALLPLVLPAQPQPLRTADALWTFQGREAALSPNPKSLPKPGLTVHGQQMTLAVRLRIEPGHVDASILSTAAGLPLLRLVDGRTKPRFYTRNGKPSGATPFQHLFHEPGDARAVTGTSAFLEYVWRTAPPAELIREREKTKSEPELSMLREGVLHVGVPLAYMTGDGFHDIVVRFSGPKVEFFVDGVLHDEEWPYGDLRDFAAPFLLGGGARGDVAYVAVWKRALSDDEVARISGLPALPSEPAIAPQYWRPRGYNSFAGDCMLTWHDGTLHLFYLHDRRQHHSKWGLGAHQFAHMSTRDLVRWTRHPLAVPITRQAEPAIGTGGVFFHNGRFYASYTDCGARVSWPGKQGVTAGVFLASGTDGLSFSKSEKPIIETNAECADNEVFFDPRDNAFHLLTPVSIDSLSSGTQLYTSSDLSAWKPRGQFAQASGACPHYFEWNGWHYLLVGGNLFYSRNAAGPWLPHSPAKLDTWLFPKGAPFANNRRIMAGWLGDQGWGGDIVFRELVQHADGTLGTKWPVEMIPAGALRARFTIDSTRTLTVFGLPVRVDLVARTLQAGSLAPVPLRSIPVTLEALRKGDLIDLQLNGEQTLIVRHKH